MRDYRFLFDSDSQGAAQFFPRRRVVTYKRAKLAFSAPDAEVVATAHEMRCIIVTANGLHFEQEARRFLQKTQKKSCHDLYGLIVIPNDGPTQSRVLPRVSEKLRMDGKRITWDDVWWENYLVRVHATGDVDVRALGRCFYCRKVQ
jgi:hypothetical protein